jgi:two-component system LytT family response regulator
MAGRQQILRTLIVDEQPQARQNLAHHLASIKGVSVAGEARNGNDTLKFIREKSTDLVFLNFKLPDANGPEIVLQLEPENMPIIVFITDPDEKTVQALKDNALDYILKPVTAEHLQHTLEKIRASLKRRTGLSNARRLLKRVSRLNNKLVGNFDRPAAKNARLPEQGDSDPIVIKEGGNTTQINQRDIEWIDAAGDYMCIQSRGTTYIIRKTMKSLEKILDKRYLHRIHRSTIINLKRVRDIEPHINGEFFLTLDSGHRVKLSRTYKHKLDLIK